MEEDDAMHGEKENTEDEAADDEKEGDTKDDKTTITTGKGRKGGEIGNEVKIPNGKENTIR